jgi:hypothetical protein
MAQLKGTALPAIRGKGDLVSLIQELGFLPAFRCHIPGFSVQECIAPEYWFADGEGFWEWKGPVIRESGCAYGKLLGGRAVFLTLDWYRELANYRRHGYDFDARYDDGLARSRDKQVFDVLWEHGSLLSKELNRLSSAGGKRKDFDAVMTRLQMLGYVVISNFEYEVSRRGKTFGWGIARYETPEKRFGAAFTDAVYAHEPAESKKILTERLKRLLPDTDEKAILRLLG